VRLVEDVVLALFVCAMVVTDWRVRRIPNVATYPAMAVGLVLGALEALPGDLFVRGLIDHVVALVLAFAVCWPFYAGGGLKGGDAKFLMAVGALRGTSFLIASALYGALLGGLIAIGVIAARRLARPADGAALTPVLKTWIPYGVALGLGTLLALALELSGRLPGMVS